MAIEKIDSEEERQTRLKKKRKETLGMDDTMEIHKSRAPESSGARSSTGHIPHPGETSIA